MVPQHPCPPIHQDFPQILHLLVAPIGSERRQVFPFPSPLTPSTYTLHIPPVFIIFIETFPFGSLPILPLSSPLFFFSAYVPQVHCYWFHPNMGVRRERQLLRSPSPGAPFFQPTLSLPPPSLTLIYHAGFHSALFEDAYYPGPTPAFSLCDSKMDFVMELAHWFFDP